MLRNLTVLAIATTLSPSAFAASFDCSRASTNIEKAICAEPALSAADSKLASLYTRLLNAAGDPTAATEFKSQQKLWLKDRNVCSDAECLQAKYASRISELENYLLGAASESREEAGASLTQATTSLKDTEPTESTDQHEVARRAANSGDFETAGNIWLALAKEGSLDAQFSLGRMYARGDGVEQDFSIAFDYVSKAASGGHLKAAKMLGDMYYRGDGVPRDLSKAAFWYRDAARRGDSVAANALAELPDSTLSGAENNPVTLASRYGGAVVGTFKDKTDLLPGVSATSVTTSDSDDRIRAVESLQPKDTAPTGLSLGEEATTLLSHSTDLTKNAAVVEVSNGAEVSKERLKEMVVIGICILGAVFILIVINGVRLGLTNQMIFYNSGKDILATLLIWFLPTLMSVPSGYIWMLGYSEKGSTVPASVMALLVLLPIATGCVVAGFVLWSSFRMNGFSFGSVCVVFAKLTLSFLVLFYWLRTGDNNRRVAFHGYVMIALVAAFMRSLVNGEKVCALRAGVPSLENRASYA